MFDDNNHFQLVKEAWAEEVKKKALNNSKRQKWKPIKYKHDDDYILSYSAWVKTLIQLRAKTPSVNIKIPNKFHLLYTYFKITLKIHAIPNIFAMTLR